MSRLLVACLLLGCWAVTATAAVADDEVSAPASTQPQATAPAAAKGGQPKENARSGNSIGDLLGDIRRDRNALFNTPVASDLARMDDWIERKTNVRWGLSYTMLYQNADDGRGPRDALGADLDLVGRWTPIDKGGKNQGSLRVAIEDRHRIGTDIAPSALSNTIDSLWPTVSGFNEQNLAIVQLFWRQDLLDGRLRIRVGKVSGYSTFFGNRLSNSNTMFLNFAFSDNPAVFFPGNGLGAHVIYRFAERWSVAVGIQDANGIKTRIDPSTLNGEFWYATQVTFSPDIRRLGRGNYRIGSWFVDSRDAADTGPGAGVVLSIDQELGDHLIGFVRWEYQGTGLVSTEFELDFLTGTRNTVRGGIGVRGPFPSVPDDYMGIAFAWGDPSAARARDSHIAEVFYRLQTTDFSQLSISYQIIQSSTVFQNVGVIGVRWRFEV